MHGCVKHLIIFSINFNRFSHDMAHIYMLVFMAEQACLSLNWWENLKTGFLMTNLSSITMTVDISCQIALFLIKTTLDKCAR